MNCGLGNLDSIKQFLLADTVAGETKFDQRLIWIGQGVAALMDRHCNRKFAYGDNLTQIFRGNRSHWYMPNYPVVSFAQVQLRYFKADNWVDISGQPLAVNEETGLLSFGYTLGVDPIQVRVTWSGGYWFEMLEPDDAGYPSQAPAAVQTATALEPSKFALPADLRLAWLTQIAEVWNKMDKLGIGLVDKPDSQTLTGALKLSPIVEEILRPYVRMQIS